MRALIGLLALVPVALVIGTLLRSRIAARARSRALHQAEVETLLQEQADIDSRKTVEDLRRELDVAVAREEKRQSRGRPSPPQDAA